jgi:hypothetical protein
MGNDGVSKVGCLGLDEALEQLILLGVCKSSTNESELVEKAKRGSLKIHLTTELSEGFRLIEAKYVKGLMKKIPVSDYSYEDTLDCSGLTLDDIADERYEVEGVDWLVTSDDAVIKELPSYTCFIPMNVIIDREELIITKSNWLSYIDEDGFDDAENLSALQIDGVDYFVVKDLSETMLFDVVERVHELNGYSGVKCCLSTDAVDASIDRNIKVVTTDELLAFEKVRSCTKTALPVNRHVDITERPTELAVSTLFPNRPKTMTSQYEVISKVACQYIEKFQKRPTRHELWVYLISSQSGLTIDGGRIVGEFKQPMCEANFKGCFNRWAK